jgi:hypothetical protein
VQHVHQGAFTGSVFPDQGVDLALLQVKVYAVKRLQSDQNI